ncbi:MAG: AzlC family ABC transporter permease [Firmicutes bacterium]|nr:AzlC family ABC transporter permease [Bacillota bacterium]
MNYSIKTEENRKAFLLGMKHAIPIGTGYFAVSFGLGITAHNAGMNALQSFLVSFLCNASAGEYAGIRVIAGLSPYIEVVLVTLIANARYLLMSLSLSQKMDPDMPFFHRLLVAYDITDELFGINIARPGYLNPWYAYGAYLVALPSWAFGTMFGAIAGEILPASLVSALSVALYGMFIAIIVPPSKADKVVFGLVAISFAASWAASRAPLLSGLSEGSRTIILTLIIASTGAFLVPKQPQEPPQHKLEAKKEAADA